MKRRRRFHRNSNDSSGARRFRKRTAPDAAERNRIIQENRVKAGDKNTEFKKLVANAIYCAQPNCYLQGFY